MSAGMKRTTTFALLEKGRTGPMHTTIVDQPNLRITNCGGTEGPAHDPYSWAEYTIERGGNSITYHYGLGEWLEFELGDSGKTRVDQPQDVDQFFSIVTGFTFSEWQDFLRRMEKAKYRAHREHDVVEVNGYPGEHFTFCNTCDKTLDSRFNINAVL